MFFFLYPKIQNVFLPLSKIHLLLFLYQKYRMFVFLYSIKNTECFFFCQKYRMFVLLSKIPNVFLPLSKIQNAFLFLLACYFFIYYLCHGKEGPVWLFFFFFLNMLEPSGKNTRCSIVCLSVESNITWFSDLQDRNDIKLNVWCVFVLEGE